MQTESATTMMGEGQWVRSFVYKNGWNEMKKKKKRRKHRKRHEQQRESKGGRKKKGLMSNWQEKKGRRIYTAVWRYWGSAKIEYARSERRRNSMHPNTVEGVAICIMLKEKEGPWGCIRPISDWMAKVYTNNHFENRARRRSGVDDAASPRCHIHPKQPRVTT